MPKKKATAKKKSKSAPKAVAKKKPKAAIKKKKAPQKSWKEFGDWWDAVGSKMTSKIESRWIKQNEPNDPEEDAGGDHWHVNQMMHSGDAHEMTYEIAEKVFNHAKNDEPWEFCQEDSLYCELDDVIIEAHEAGKAR